MFYNLRYKMNLQYFNARTNGIKEKARVKTDPSSKIMIVTLLCNTDINMYLLALSSFCRFVTPREIVIVSDRLTEANCKILKKCVKDLKIIPVEDYREQGLPIGGCWERFTCVLKNLPDTYVVQLDADTLTLMRPDEVIQAIDNDLSFSLTTKLGFEKMSFVNASYLVWERSSKHVQNEAEKAFKNCRNAESRRYIRACAGFAGYAKQSFTLDAIKEFSKELEEKLGREKWSEWGSEQVASNYAIANTEGSVILPYQYYPFYEPGLDESGVKFLHFIGTHRFKKGSYITHARQLINEL